MGRLSLIETSISSSKVIHSMQLGQLSIHMWKNGFLLYIIQNTVSTGSKPKYESKILSFLEEKKRKSFLFHGREAFLRYKTHKPHGINLTTLKWKTSTYQKLPFKSAKKIHRLGKTFAKHFNKDECTTQWEKRQSNRKMGIRQAQISYGKENMNV